MPADEITKMSVDPTRERIHLSVPHMSGFEEQYVKEAFASNWIAPLGPQVNAFEREFAAIVNAEHVVALASGTAAMHLAYQLAGIGPGDEVLVSTMTFAATVNPILYLGARPVFVDSERASWNIDPDLVEESLRARRKRNKTPKAISVVHLYGQTANLERLTAICQEYEVLLIEDAAEALGATFQGRAAGTFGAFGVFSFNGNKIITTSGGGILVSDEKSKIQHALKLATQAREPAPHYEHTEVGYNYRMSNVLAAIGRGQLRVLQDRVDARRRNFEHYQQALAEHPGISFMPEAPWGRHSRWLTTLTIDPVQFGANREIVRTRLEEQNIEARPLWKPMHQQPVFQQYDSVGGAVASELFAKGLCLPSSSNLTKDQLERVVDTVRNSYNVLPASQRSSTEEFGYTTMGSDSVVREGTL